MNIKEKTYTLKLAFTSYDDLQNFKQKVKDEFNFPKEYSRYELIHGTTENGIVFVEEKENKMNSITESTINISWSDDISSIIEESKDKVLNGEIIKYNDFTEEITFIDEFGYEIDAELGQYFIYEKYGKNKDVLLFVGTTVGCGWCFFAYDIDDEKILSQYMGKKNKCYLAYQEYKNKYGWILEKNESKLIKESIDVKIIYWDDTPSEYFDDVTKNDLIDFENDGNVYKIIDVTNGKKKTIFVND